MLEIFKEHINNSLNYLKEGKLLIAISGGLDSVVLTHLCHHLGLNVGLADCNYNVRGEESQGDEVFGLLSFEDVALEVFLANFDADTVAKDQKLATHMAARTLRYHSFSDLAEQWHFDYILTAHHADDNLETFLINLTRGTGLDGFTGIPEVNGKIIRP